MKMVTEKTHDLSPVVTHSSKLVMQLSSRTLNQGPQTGEFLLTAEGVGKVYLDLNGKLDERINHSFLCFLFYPSPQHSGDL